MPKDASKNVDRYKIRGGTLNEFEFAENQEALAEDKPKQGSKLIPGTPPEERQRPQVAAKKAATKKKATKSTKTNAKSTNTKTVATRGASAKKLAARKAAKKK